ncbi:DUF6545 domain-containing protein [Streptomyces sp. NPDC002004]
MRGSRSIRRRSPPWRCSRRWLTCEAKAGLCGLLRSTLRCPRSLRRLSSGLDTRLSLRRRRIEIRDGARHLTAWMSTAPVRTLEDLIRQTPSPDVGLVAAQATVTLLHARRCQVNGTPPWPSHCACRPFPAPMYPRNRSVLTSSASPTTWGNRSCSGLLNSPLALLRQRLRPGEPRCCAAPCQRRLSQLGLTAPTCLQGCSGQ